MLCFLHRESFVHYIGFVHRKLQHVVGLLQVETVTQPVFVTRFDSITQYMQKKQATEVFGRDAVVKDFTKGKASFLLQSFRLEVSYFTEITL